MTPFDIAFFDPPYRMVQNIVPGKLLFKSLERLAREDVTSEDALLVFRTPRQAVFQLPDAWQLERTLDYSRMEVHWFRKQSRSTDDTPADEEATEEASDPEEQGAENTVSEINGQEGNAGSA